MLLIDSTIGSNAKKQVERFQEIANISGLVITKLDGTAKAGQIVGIVKEFLLPVTFRGGGDKLEELYKFSPKQFAKAILDIE